MASTAAEEEDSLFFLSEDELLEIQFDLSTMNQTRSSRNIHLPRPQPFSDRSSRLRAQQEHIRDHIPRLQSLRRPQHQAPPQQEAPVIDLTAEPDSPVQSRPPVPPRRSDSQTQGGRNPRRTNSQRISPPRLARSDSTFMAQASSFIDLTTDSPEEERPAAEGLRNRGAHNPPQRPRPDELIDIEFIQSVPRRGMPGFAIGIGRRLAGIFSADIINFNQPNLDVSRNAFAPRESPKPPMEPVPPTREGFTRDTCAEPEKESENVVICPACSEELAYDPSGKVAPSTTSAGKKRKRAPGEHHFWALKKCGHVYCADCFENRKPTKTNKSGFRASVHSNSANDLRCAVEDCDTKVALKGEWVGIYL